MTTHEALWFLMAPNWQAPVFCAIACAIHAVLDGECDARHFDRPPSKRQENWPDIHKDFTARRVCLWFVVAWCAGLPVTIGCILMFPYLHDGHYYYTRRMIDMNVYAQGWASEPSSTNTARWSFSYRTRRWLAVAGLSIIAAVVIVSVNCPELVR